MEKPELTEPEIEALRLIHDNEPVSDDRTVRGLIGRGYVEYPMTRRRYEGGAAPYKITDSGSSVLALLDSNKKKPR